MTNRIAFSAEQPADARRIVQTALGAAPGEIVETVQLLTSELVTNAIVHSSCHPVLLLEVEERRVRMEVQDSDPQMNFLPLQADSVTEHGRGLMIVDALASSWGMEPRSSGKVVWFQLNF